AFYPADGNAERDVADAAQLSSLADETPEGRSVVVLAKQKYGIRERQIHELDAHFVPFTAQTRMSGVNYNGTEIRKGSADAIEAYCAARGSSVPPAVRARVETISRKGGTPLVVASNHTVLGVIEL